MDLNSLCGHLSPGGESACHPKTDIVLSAICPRNAFFMKNELAVAIRNAFPVTPLHTLVIPKRHVSDIFDLSRPETNAYNELMKETKRNIEQTDPSVSAFNVGVNNGRAAGQTVEHCHIHLIPRRVGDVENPVGGIRKVISAKPS